jgi:putative chitinase
MQKHKKNKSVTSASTNRRSIRMRQLLENKNSFSMLTSSIPVKEYKMLTAKQFAGLFRKAEDPQSWVDSMNDVFPRYEINTPKRIAAFLAQCGYESGGWSVFEENLNYTSAKRLRVIFKNYFPTEEFANDYVGQPQKIANRVYGGRLGNGPEESGDGWLYRGRGPIQLTGKYNYREFSKYMFKENLIEDEEKILNNPYLVAATATADRKFALMSAIWFWNNKNLNDEADAGNLETMTRKINGGSNGLTDRIELYDKAIRLLDG